MFVCVYKQISLLEKRDTNGGGLSRIPMSIGFYWKQKKNKKGPEESNAFGMRQKGWRSIPTLKGRTNESMCKHFTFILLLNAHAWLYDLNDFYALSQRFKVNLQRCVSRPS